ncbi:MAG: hypothetical protein R3F29_12315 [Planctomycetota bacterium]
MHTRPLSTLAAILAATLTACVFGARPEALRRLAVLHAPNTFKDGARLEVIVVDPDGSKHNASGEVARGGTTRALCESLLHSLAYNGCDATREDAVTAADPLVRSMQQNVLLPEGWHFVSARNLGVGGAPDSELVLTLEAVR